MIRQLACWSGHVDHDDEAGESRIRNTVPNFFKTKHGKRETYSFYRGAVIVRNTVQFSGCKPERKTTLYLLVRYPDTGNWDTYCAGWPKTVSQAQLWVDQILAGERKLTDK